MRFVLLLLTFLIGQQAEAACTTPEAGVAGQFKYISGEMKYCNDTNWVSMKYGGATVASTLVDTNPYTLSGPKGAAIVGSYGYVAGSTSDYKLAIGVVNLTTPASASIVNVVSHATKSSATEMASDGTYLYIIASTELVIYNLTVPTAPAYVGAVTIGDGNTLSSIAVSGNYVYVTKPNEDKLMIIDVTTKASPTLVGNYISSVNLDGANDVFVSGNYAYVTAEEIDSLAIINVTTKASPSFSGSVTNARFDRAGGVAVSGNYAYVIGKGGPQNAGAFSVVDVTNKTAPVFVTAVEGSPGDDLEAPNDIVVSGGLVYVAQSAGRNIGSAYVTVFDVSVPSNPGVKNCFTVKYASSTTRGIDRIAIVGNRIIATEPGNRFINVFDSTAASQPDLPFDGSLSDGSSNTFYAVSISGTRAIAVTYSGLTFCLDISNPASITVISKIQVGAGGSDVFYDGTYAYIAGGGDNNISIVNYTTPASPAVVRTIANQYNVGRLAKSGSYLYLATYDGLTIIDVTTPASASVVGSLSSLGTFGYGIAISGNYAYVSFRQENRIVVVNITNKTAPSVVTTLNDAVNLYSVNDIAISGNYLYAVPMNSSTYFTVVNITTPASPTVAASITNASYGISERIRISGSYAYSMSYNAGLTVTNISTPTAPVRVSSTTAGGGTQGAGVDVTGTTAIGVYRDTSSPTVVAWNASVPASITVSGSFYFPGNFESTVAVATEGNYAYSISGIDSRLVVTNITNAAAPTVAGTVTDASLANGWQIAYSAGYVFVVGASKAAVVNVSTPSAPVVSGSVTDGPNLGAGRDVKISGNYAYVATDNRFTVVDHSVKTAPVVSASITHADFISCNNLALSGSYAFMTCNQKLMVVSIATPTSPSVVGSLAISGAIGIGISGNKAYVTSSQKIHAIDISTPTAPTIINYVPSYGGSMEIFGNYIYVIGQGYGLISHGILPDGSVSPMGINKAYLRLYEIAISSTRIVAVSYDIDTLYVSPIASLAIPPGPAKLIGTGSATLGASSTVKSGNYVYLLGGSSLSVVNVADPINPVIVSSAIDPNLMDTKSMAQSGSYLYISGSGSSSALLVYDVSSPTSPVYVNSISAYPQLNGISTLKSAGGYLYALSPGTSYFSVIDISVPSAPVLVGSLTGLNYASSYDLSGNYAYVCSASSSSLYVVSVSNPAAPSIVGTLTNAVFSDCMGVSVSGSYVYAVSNAGDMLSITNVTIPTAPSLAGTYSSATLLNSPKTVVVSGNYAYINTVDSAVVVDVTNKSAPVFNDSVSTSDFFFPYGYNYAFASNYIYLPVNNSLKIFNATPIVTQGACSAAGEVKYNTANNVLTFCNGSSYMPTGVSPGTGGAGCTTPTNSIGAIQYRTSTNKLEYCDGTSWRPIN